VGWSFIPEVPQSDLHDVGQADKRRVTVLSRDVDQAPSQTLDRVRVVTVNAPEQTGQVVQHPEVVVILQDKISRCTHTKKYFVNGK